MSEANETLVLALDTLRDISDNYYKKVCKVNMSRRLLGFTATHTCTLHDHELPIYKL